MNSQNLPKISDRSFLMHREVIVTNIYELFRLIKVIIQKNKLSSMWTLVH